MRKIFIILCILVLFSSLAYFSESKLVAKTIENISSKLDLGQFLNRAAEETPPSTPVEKPSETDSKPDEKEQAPNPKEKEQEPEENKVSQPDNKPDQQEDSIAVISEPDSIPVLVNKQNKLPDGYVPTDLVKTNIPFIPTAITEKRMMRKEAADAIAEMFEAAKAEGVHLLGVSAYRSYNTQSTLFNYYVQKDGYEKARTYSALPGTSEHQTGLSIDVTGGDGKCAVQDCFGDTIEAKWVEENAAKFGFIVRYPKGKEEITGYKYEPWHLRYVGIEIALEVKHSAGTLEEYYDTIPVNN